MFGKGARSARCPVAAAAKVNLTPRPRRGARTDQTTASLSEPLAASTIAIGRLYPRARWALFRLCSRTESGRVATASLRSPLGRLHGLAGAGTRKLSWRHLHHVAREQVLIECESFVVLAMARVSVRARPICRCCEPRRRRCHARYVTECVCFLSCLCRNLAAIFCAFTAVCSHPIDWRQVKTCAHV